MTNDSALQASIVTAVPPEDPEKQKELHNSYYCIYRQAIGGVIYTVVKCRSDISYDVIKLFQYSANPAEAH